MKSIEIKAPAKINIGLNIVGKRDDGYHNLETFFYPINDLYDVLKFEHSDKFTFTCNIAALNDHSENLVSKAKNLLEEYCKRELLVKINLLKNIPTGAGLGGGSSDAAATLISLNELFKLNIEYNSLLNLALKLGSDVPFFLKAKPAVGKSRGEVLTLVDFELPYHIVIVNPGIHISTKEAFKHIVPEPSNINYENVFNTIGSFIQKKDSIRNDFENYVFGNYSEIKKLKEMMLENGAIFSLMSGSGSTAYGLFENDYEAKTFVELVPKYYFTKICSPAT